MLLNKIKYVVKKTSNNTDDLIFDNLSPSLKLIPIIFIFIYLSLIINDEGKFLTLVENVNKSLTIIFIFWFLYSLISLLQLSVTKLENIFNKAITIWIRKSIGYLIIFLGVVALLDVWGIKLGPILAGLGLFGVAVALGAQDLLKI